MTSRGPVLTDTDICVYLVLTPIEPSTSGLSRTISSMSPDVASHALCRALRLQERRRSQLLGRSQSTR